ncbi:hypothetical protein BDN71DRAFT_1491548, partial [Pleurotus eryngii]
MAYKIFENKCGGVQFGRCLVKQVDLVRGNGDWLTSWSLCNRRCRYCGTDSVTGRPSFLVNGAIYPSRGAWIIHGSEAYGTLEGPVLRRSFVALDGVDDRRNHKYDSRGNIPVAKSRCFQDPLRWRDMDIPREGGRMRKQLDARSRLVWVGRNGEDQGTQRRPQSHWTMWNTAFERGYSGVEHHLAESIGDWRRSAVLRILVERQWAWVRRSFRPTTSPSGGVQHTGSVSDNGSIASRHTFYSGKCQILASAFVIIDPHQATTEYACQTNPNIIIMKPVKIAVGNSIQSRTYLFRCFAAKQTVEKRTA